MSNAKKNSPPKRLRSPLTFLKDKDGHHRHASGIYNEGYDYNQEILVNKNLNIVFQPIVDLSSNNFHAFEALSRPPQGSPLDFKSPFAIIEEKNHRKLDRVCLDHIFRNIHKFEQFDELNHQETFFFINCLLSNIDYLRKKNLSREIKEKTTIEFDLNHTFFDIHEFVKSIKLLKREHFKIAVDDVGETNIDMQLLNIISPEFIKIDISVILGIAESDKKKKLAERIIHKADLLDAQVIAEGVEKKEDLEVIKSMGVNLIQGFLFSKPMQIIPQERQEIDNIIKKAA